MGKYKPIKNCGCGGRVSYKYIEGDFFEGNCIRCNMRHANPKPREGGDSADSNIELRADLPTHLDVAAKTQSQMRAFYRSEGLNPDQY